MNPTTIANFVMSATALLVAGGGGLKWLLGRKHSVRQEDRADEKSQTDIALSTKQVKQVNEEAEKVYSTNRIEIEKWWLEQFQLVQKQLTEERETQNLRWAKFRKAAKVHKVWDDEQRAEAEAAGRHVRPAPSLDPDDYELEDGDDH